MSMNLKRWLELSAEYRNENSGLRLYASWKVCVEFYTASSWEGYEDSPGNLNTKGRNLRIAAESVSDKYTFAKDILMILEHRRLGVLSPKDAYAQYQIHEDMGG